MRHMLRYETAIGGASLVGAAVVALATAACSGGNGGSTAVDGGIDAAPMGCAAGGTPTMHTTDVTGEETWAAGVHVVPSSLNVTGGGHLTIAPCADVRLGVGASITVKATALGLDALGTSDQPITFEPNGASPWGNIDVTSPAIARFAYATLSGGGTGPHDQAPAAGATIAVHGADATRPIALSVQHTTIAGSGGLGIFLRLARFDPTSTELTIKQSGWYPLYTGIGSVTEIPTGAYTGNAIDQILLQTFNTAAFTDDGALLSDVTMANRGVPYRVGTIPSSVIVGDGLPASPQASLTIQAGVTMLFTPEGTGAVSQLLVRGTSTGAAQGALIVSGTPAAPVLFDSAGGAPAAGDWQGLYFANVVDPRSSIANAQILHAGGYSSTVGRCPSTSGGNANAATCAVIISTSAAPSAFITGSLFADTTCGVYRGWPMGDVDFTGGNQFMTVPGCTQTSLPKSDGSCDPCSTSP